MIYRIYSNISLGDYCFIGHFVTNNFSDITRISHVDAIYLVWSVDNRIASNIR